MIFITPQTTDYRLFTLQIGANGQLAAEYVYVTIEYVTITIAALYNLAAIFASAFSSQECGQKPPQQPKSTEEERKASRAPMYLTS